MGAVRRTEMITAQPTQDLALIRSVITHPKIWEHVSDDYSGAPESFEPPRALYLAVHDGAELLGVFMVHPHNAINWEVHTCLMPNAWGARAKAAAQAAIAWMWANTPAERLITNVPVPNRLALRFAKQAGFTEFGRNPNSFQKHGILHEQILLGISKGQ
jgi:RimJ/RimL family protein N-acetyltransferase